MAEKAIGVVNPFPGLRSFESDESWLFFGREQQIAETRERLFSTRFLAVVGSSGSGKSSLVRAGLIPSLTGESKQGKAEWKIALLRPGNAPVVNLARVLAEVVRPVEASGAAMSAGRIEQLICSDTDQFATQIDKAATSKILVLVDQFEEIFRFRSRKDGLGTQEASAAFVNFLTRIPSLALSNLHVAITMRADFLGDCTEYVELNKALNKGQYLVPRMTPQDQKQAITQPIAVCGGAITDRLVDRLLLDTGNDPDQLPILQHAMMRTWSYWQQHHSDNQPLDVSHYEAIGTMREALSLHAEEVFGELNDPRSVEITEKVFKALTNLGEDNRGTRRPTKLKEICALANSKEEHVISVIDKFRADGRAFLMPGAAVVLTPETTVDISHESLMRVWSRLRIWVEEETKSAELYLRLSKNAELHQEGKTGLLVNPELQIAQKWKQETKPNSTWASRYDPAFERAMTFLDTSIKSYNFDVQKRENQQRQKLKRARFVAIFLGSASVVSLLLLMVALNLKTKAEVAALEAMEQKKLAVTESKKAEVQKKEAVSQRNISDQQQEIARLQQQIAEKEKQNAVQQQQIAELERQRAVQQEKIAVQQKQEAESQRALAEKARSEAEAQRKAAVEQRKLAEEQREKAEKSERNAQRLRLLSVGRSLAIQSTIMARTDKTELPALLALQAYNFNKTNNGFPDDPDIFKALSTVADDKPVFRGHNDGVRSLRVSADGEDIVTVGDDGTVKIFDARLPDQNPKTLKMPPLASAPVNSTRTGREALRIVELSEKGNLVAAGRVDGAVIVWNLSEKDPQPKVLPGNTSIVRTLAFSRDGSKLVAGTNDGAVKVWSVDQFNGPISSPLTLPVKINAVAFSPDGSRLVVASGDGAIRLLDWANPSSQIRNIQTGERENTAVSFSPDGKSLAVGGASGKIRIVDISSSAVREFTGHSSSVTEIVFESKGSLFASASLDKTIRVWNLKNSEVPPMLLEGHDGWVWSIGFSPDATKLYSGSADRTLRSWVIRPDLLADRICGKARRSLSQEEWARYIGTNVPFEKTCR